MQPDTFRPAVLLKGDRIHIFVGSAFYALPLAAAETLNEKLAAAIAQLKAQENSQA